MKLKLNPATELRSSLLQLVWLASRAQGPSAVHDRVLIKVSFETRGTMGRQWSGHSEC